MEIRNLQIFLKAASLLNFTQTARELGYSQSNISMQIHQLEEEVGALLFDRIGKSVALTHQGQELLPYAQQIVSLAEQMENALKPEKELGGIIRVGMCQSVFETVFEQILKAYQKRFPRVQMEVTVGGTENLLYALLKNRLDIVCIIDQKLSRREWRCHYEKPVRIGAVVSTNHRLSRRELLRVEDLHNEHFILMEGTAPYNQLLYSLFSGINLEERTRLRLESCRVTARLVASGREISFLPEYTVRDMVQNGQVSFLPLEGYDPQQTVQLVTHKDKVMTPQIKGFIEEAAGKLEAAL